MKHAVARPVRLMHLFICGTICLATAVSSPAAAWFLPLGEEQDHWSDASASGLVGGYNSGTGRLEISGAMNYTNGFEEGPGFTDVLGMITTFDLIAENLHSAASAPITGSLTLHMVDLVDLTAPHAVDSDFLAGTILDVKFPDPLLAPGQIEFLFRIDGGTAAPSFGGVGAHGGIKLNTKKSTTVDFSEGFSFDNADADVLGVVPEPTSLVMLGGCAAMGALILATRRQLRRVWRS
jgi:hypothetical protein